jgi:hypothetical protein
VVADSSLAVSVGSGSVLGHPYLRHSVLISSPQNTNVVTPMLSIWELERLYFEGTISSLPHCLLRPECAFRGTEEGGLLDNPKGLAVVNSELHTLIA